MLEHARRTWLLGPLVLVLLCLGVVGTAPAAENIEESPFDIAPDAEKFDDDAEKKGDPNDPFFENRKGLNAELVSSAIDKGVRWLERVQRAGNWGDIRGNSTYGGGAAGQGQDSYRHPAGATALALLALLKCGVPLDNKYVERGFEFLQKNYRVPGGSYECSVLLLALIATGDPHKSTKGRVKVPSKYRTWAHDVLDSLIERRRQQGWRYQLKRAQPGATIGGEQDLNSTQWAVLALLEAHRAGLKTPRKVLEDVIQFTLAQQETEGKAIDYPLGGAKVRKARARGFAYILGDDRFDEGKPTGAVSAGGVANLQIVRYILTDEMSEKGLKKWNERPDAQQIQHAIYDGLAWMHVNWNAQKNPGKDRSNIYHFYWLYATERAMDLLGLKLVGQRPWYANMGTPLLQKQHADGHWDSDSTHEPGEVLDTCFALLFLCRSTKDTIPNPQVTPGEANPSDVR